MSGEDPTVSRASDAPEPTGARRIDGTTRFAAGTDIAGRYRIVALLGKGGMGEVYRADDLVLGQSVALKFLPAALSADPVRLERFRREVSLARRISHPNVCRVYDVGEANGHHFLAMEYIDGEDLASLVRRIGRLPGEKAAELARQICAGLAAAHEQGVIHRDLKPANVMIDGRGKARIADFGVAAMSDEIAAGAPVFAGTPAYMAPEQLDGREVTTRSDLYALGLVLYELFTGTPAHAAATLEDLRRIHESSAPPTHPSEIVRDIDPLAERVILACLEADPRDRPPGALAVMAALPGGDPLRAMLEAGETPSPELVAASGRSGTLAPRTAALLAFVALATFGVAIALIARLPVHQLAGGLLPPDVLEHRAREIVAALGYGEPPIDTARGYAMLSFGGETMDEVRAQFARDVPGVIRFWYRQHAGMLVAKRSTTPGSAFGDTVTRSDPPPLEPGMIGVELSGQGRLLSFERVTPEFAPQGDDAEAESDSPAATIDWASVLALARLDGMDLQETAPKWRPRSAWDERRAWIAVPKDGDGPPLRVEAAAFGGRLTSWVAAREADLAPFVRERQSLTGADAVSNWLILLGLFGGTALAIRNLRCGRGDRRGAARLGVVLFLSSMVGWLFTQSHSADPVVEARYFISNVSYALMRTGLACAIYVGLEPYIRRYLPTALVSWSRLLAGRWRDPIVGRDLLVALAVSGTIWCALTVAGTAADMRGLLIPVALPEASAAVGGMFRAPAIAIAMALSWMIFFVLVNGLLRRPRWLAPVAFWVVLATIFRFVFGQGVMPLYLAAVLLIGVTGTVVIIYRFGLLALLVFGLVSNIVLRTPFTIDFSTWYVAPTVVFALLVAGLVLFGYRVATAPAPGFAHGAARGA